MDGNSSDSQSSDSGLSSAQLRKIRKPILERKRRGRINESLNELKALILEAMNKEEAGYSKMEKADILEMTVQHLRESQTRKASHGNTPYSLIAKYQSGFSECASEVNRYLSSTPELSPEERVRIMQHLDRCGDKKLKGVEQSINGQVHGQSEIQMLGGITHFNGQVVAQTIQTQTLPECTPLSILPGNTIGSHVVVPQQILSRSPSPDNDATQTNSIYGHQGFNIFPALSNHGLSNLYMDDHNSNHRNPNFVVSKPIPIAPKSRLGHQIRTSYSPETAMDVPAFISKTNRFEVQIPQENSKHMNCENHKLNDSLDNGSVWRPW